MKSRYQILLSLVSVALISFFLAWVKFLYTPLITTAEGVRFLVPEGASFKLVINELARDNVVKNPNFFALLVRLKAKDHDLKAGEYLFPKGATPSIILNQMITGTGMYYYTFTIIPGWNFLQLRNALAQIQTIKHVAATMSDVEVMQYLNHPELKPEGLFFPESYYYVRGTQDLALLKRAFQLMQAKLDAAWQQRDAGLYFKSPYEALIAASLVEKEAKLSGERAMIAGVIVNRLQKNMLLQIDPTVIYGVGRFDGKITKKDLIAKNAYNTYVIKGLPPTPIAIPSMDSISAALHPQHHQYYYFVANAIGDGSHQFSTTLTQHTAAVTRLRKKAS